MQDHDYLTTAEVCAYLRLKERTIYELVSRKAIPCSRATGKLLFPRRLIDRWVEANLDMQDARLLAPPPIVAGSSDPLLDWALRESGSGLATLAEGSEAGLRRFAEGAALAAGVHIYGGAQAGYNVAAVRAIGTVVDLVLIGWAERDQGLVVARGNPLGLMGLDDVAKKRARLIQRQPGAGAQILFDELAREAGLAAADFSVAAGTALTETDVASAVADGVADCGLAVGAVARHYGLDFVKLHKERFDIACRRRSYFEPPLQKLFAFARTEAFRAKAASLGAYDLAVTGRVHYNA
ncbi:MAG TPA: helix-turn-helix transcriptional regulator [Alphaproteobacteria bacterium]|nr:helix-turn-helix transcriptional regulator [Alphaproteobacteria bacterium]